MINNISAPIPLSINLKGNLLLLDKPIVMGVLNITKDSFYEKSRFQNNDDLITQTEKMLSAGAAIIDVGAASSRPGAKLISAEEEIDLLLPALQNLLQHFPEAVFSIDTYNSKTAIAAAEMGAALINDISAGAIDDQMFSAIAALNIPYVMMHMQGIPEHMQKSPKYDDVVQETIQYFVHKVEIARQAGIKDIIIDPGFGFGKSLEHNFMLLKNLKLFEVFQLPILCGLSRKSFINKVINTKADEALNGTTVLNTIALLNGANILRVHDALEAKQTIDLVNYYSNTNEL
jgi:dihydropteroate synthase